MSFEFSQPQTLIHHIRRRPEVFVGDRAQAGLQELLNEALGYALKEALFRRCTRLEITLNYNQQVIIRDNSPGIDTTMIDALGVSLLEFKLTRRSAERHHGMEAHPLYGIGLPVVNALSEEFITEVRRDGYLWRQEYCYGEKQTPVMRVRRLRDGESSGLTLIFKPDFEIFEHQDYDYVALVLRLRVLAFLVPDLAITIKDERIGLRDYFQNSIGLRDFTRFLNRGHELLHDPAYGFDEIETLMIGSWSYTVRVEIAFQFAVSDASNQRTFVNTMQGSNVEAQRAMRAGMSWALNRFARENGMLRSSDPNFTMNEISVGLTSIISVYHLYTSTGNQRFSHMLQQNTWEAALRATIKAIGLFERRQPTDLHHVMEKMLYRRLH